MPSLSTKPGGHAHPDHLGPVHGVGDRRCRDEQVGSHSVMLSRWIWLLGQSKTLPQSASEHSQSPFSHKLQKYL
jgi:hypothetical protein